MLYRAFHASRFNSLAAIHGGGSRSRQVQELILHSGFEVSSLPGIPSTFRNIPKDIIVAAGAYIASPHHRRTIEFAKDLYRTAAGIRRNRIDVVISEDSYWNPELLELAVGAKFVAVPQNIESLVPGQCQTSASKKSTALAKELRDFGRADACFTICPEDASIVAAYNPSTYLLPYFPPQSQLMAFREIRRKRETRCLRALRDGFVLALGSVTNEPTRRGLVELIAYLKSATLPIKFIVAGNGTEAFFDQRTSMIEILGTVSNEVLIQLQEEARCLMVHHFPSTGSLTRIIDALVSGIPVLTNRYGARGTSGLKGLHVYTNLRDSLDIIASMVAYLPEEPPRPVADERSFAECLRRLAAERLL